MALIQLVGKGMESIDLISSLFHSSSMTGGRPTYNMAAPEGLCLMECEFAPPILWISTGNQCMKFIDKLYAKQKVKSIQHHQLHAVAASLSRSTSMDDVKNTKTKYVSILKRPQCKTVDQAMAKQKQNLKRKADGEIH